MVDLDIPKGDHGLSVGTPQRVADGVYMLGLLAEEHGERYPRDTYAVPDRQRWLRSLPHCYVRGRAARLSGQARLEDRHPAYGGYVVGAGSEVDGRSYEVARELAPGSPSGSAGNASGRSRWPPDGLCSRARWSRYSTHC